MLTYEICKAFKNIDLETGRVYEVPNHRFPSVTTVLKHTADMSRIDNWRASVGEEEADRILHEASFRGTKLHSYLEIFYEQYSQPTIEQAREFIASSGLLSEPEHIIGMVKRMIQILVANRYRSLAQEFVVWSEELKLAGRCDSIGYFNDGFTLVDFKTARKEKPLAYIRDYFLQATAYCVAHNSLFEQQVNRFVIIIVNEKGTHQIFSGTPRQYLPELKYRVNKFYEFKKNQGSSP